MTETLESDKNLYGRSAYMLLEYARRDGQWYSGINGNWRVEADSPSEWLMKHYTFTVLPKSILAELVALKLSGNLT